MLCIWRKRAAKVISPWRTGISGQVQKAFITVKYVNPITNMCIIRASREEFQKVWSAITMVRDIGNCSVIFNLLDLSGISIGGDVFSSSTFCDHGLRLNSIPQIQMTRSVKVSNISSGATQQDLKEFLTFPGKIEYIEMLRDLFEWIELEVLNHCSFGTHCYSWLKIGHHGFSLFVV